MQQTSPLKTVLVSTLATALLIFVAQYLIGKQEIRIGIAIIPILPMLFAVIIGMIVSGWLTDHVFKGKAHRTCFWFMAGVLLIAGFVRSFFFTSVNALSFADIGDEDASKATSMSAVVNIAVLNFASFKISLI